MAKIVSHTMEANSSKHNRDNRSNVDVGGCSDSDGNRDSNGDSNNDSSNYEKKNSDIDRYDNSN